MKIKLKCFATLVDPGTCDFTDATEYDLANGQTVEDLALSAGIEKNDVKIAFVNNRKAALQTTLSDGDRVALSPAVGGM